MIIFLPDFILAGIWANFRTLTHSSRLAVRSAAYSFPVIIHWVRASDSLQETHVSLVTKWSSEGVYRSYDDGPMVS